MMTRMTSQRTNSVVIRFIKLKGVCRLLLAATNEKVVNVDYAMFAAFFDAHGQLDNRRSALLKNHCSLVIRFWKLVAGFINGEIVWILRINRHLRPRCGNFHVSQIFFQTTSVAEGILFEGGPCMISTLPENLAAKAVIA